MVTDFGDVLNPSFSQYLGYESAANSVRTYQPLVFPGFLQTEDYAEALLAPMAPAERARRVVELRTARQERIFEGDDAPELSFVVDEAAPRRRIGGPAVMRHQSQHIKSLMRLPRVSLKVLPFGAGAHYSTLGSFLLLGFKDDDDLWWRPTRASSPSGTTTNSSRGTRNASPRSAISPLRAMLPSP